MIGGCLRSDRSPQLRLSPVPRLRRTTAVAFVPVGADVCIISAASDKSVRLWVQVDAAQGRFECRRSLGKRPAEVRAIAAAT